MQRIVALLIIACSFAAITSSVAFATPTTTERKTAGQSATQVDDAMLTNVAKQWKQQHDEGKLELNNPDDAPKMKDAAGHVIETTAPSSGKKRYYPTNYKKSSSVEQITKSGCPQPNCSTPPQVTPPPPGYPAFSLALVNNGSSWSPSQMTAYATALQNMFNRQHVYAWGVAATVTPYNSAEEWLTSNNPSWPVFIDGICHDCDGAAYHDSVNVNGVCLPYAQVEDWADDLQFSETAVSHEMLEMVDNPACNQVDRVVKYNKVLYLVEVVDPVEDYSYPLDGHTIVNWQFPSYWLPTMSGPRNQMGLSQNVLFPVCGPDFTITGDVGSDYQIWAKSQKDNFKYYDCLGQAALV